MRSSREPSKVIYSQNRPLSSEAGGDGERLGGRNDHSPACPHIPGLKCQYKAVQPWK